ncbi:MAG TPA: ArsR family transcriptional regulator, partial [Negativicutes bacterium]
NISQSNASRHLTKLRYARLITSEKQAQWVYYQVDEASLEQYPFVRELLAKELTKEPVCQKDETRLKKYREQGGCCERRVQITDE